MDRLQHKFGDDGIFWMSYEDLLRKYQRLDRTRIFGPDWRITQQWTSLHVPWSADYHQTRFSVNVARTTPVVIVLSQLDRTYFCGLQGQYGFKLQFRVQKAGEEEDYIVRSNVDYYMTRSVSTDITLEAGSYFVLMKITATRMGGPSMEEVISNHAEQMRDKLIQVGLSYDIAHAKGVIVETEKEKQQRESGEKAKAAAVREKLKDEARQRKEKQWKKDKKYQKRGEMQDKRRERLAEEKAARRRLHEADDGHPDARDSFPAERDSSYVGNGTAASNGDRSFTGEFIAAYERSEGTPTPTTAGPDEIATDSLTNGTGQSHEINRAVSDEKTAPSPTRTTVKDDPPTPKVQINGVDAVTDVKPLKRRPAPLAPSLTPDGNFNETDQSQQGGTSQAEVFDEPQWSDSDVPSEFDWQTDLDYDSEDDHSSYAQSEQGGDLDRNEEPGPEPWNAVCVVGLRVYSKDPDLSLEVVRPNPYSAEEKKEVGGALDRDDPAKGAVAEKWAKTPLRGTFDLD